MSETRVKPPSVDGASYWPIASRLEKLMALRGEEITDSKREIYQETEAEMQALRAEVRRGGTTGDDLMDRLIASGQIMTPERLEELRLIEAVLIIGEPVLLQQGRNWKTGVVVHNELLFSSADRSNRWGP